MLTEKRPGKIIAPNFKKINMFNFISVSIFFPVFIKSKYLQVPYINVLGFRFQKATLQAWFQTTRNETDHKENIVLSIVKTTVNKSSMVQSAFI